MSQKYKTRNNIKKLEDSFSDKHSDSDQDDTKIQPNDEQKPFKKSSKVENKVESRTIQVKKKEEYSRRFDNVSGVKNIKEQQDQDRNDFKKESKILKNQVEKVLKYQKNEQIEEKQQRRTERSKTKRDEMENEANEIMNSIDQAYEQDVELYKKKKPADKKLKLMPYVMMRLKEIELAKKLHKNGWHVTVHTMVESKRINSSRDIIDSQNSCVEFVIGFERNKTKHSKF